MERVSCTRNIDRIRITTTFTCGHQKWCLGARRVISANMLVLQHGLCRTEIPRTNNLKKGIAESTLFMTDIANTYRLHIAQCQHGPRF